MSKAEELAKQAGCYREDCGFSECSFENLETFRRLCIEDFVKGVDVEPTAWRVTFRDEDGTPRMELLPHPVHPQSNLAQRYKYTEEPLYTAAAVRALKNHGSRD